MTRHNVELKKEIIKTQTQQQKILMENAELRKEIMQIRAKQQLTQTECNEKTNEINKINEELKHAKRELTQLTKKIDIVKENNVTLNKKFKDQKNESEQQIVTLKTINLDLENKVNKKNMNNEPTTCKQDQQHQQQSNREIIQKGTQEKHSIYVIDLLEQSIKDQQLQEITKKYGKVIYQEIRKDGKGKIGNIAIVTYSTEESAEKAITGINKTNKYTAKKYEYETSSEVLLIKETDQEKQRAELQIKKPHPIECYACGSSNHIIMDYNKNATYMYLIEKRKL